METGIERSGGIAGSAEGTLTDNYFIDEGLGGVGGSSYDRSAQALPFSDMTGSEIIPEKMTGFSDDGKRRSMFSPASFSCRK